MLDTEVMPDNTVDANAAIIEIVIGQHDQDGILPHFTLNQNRVTPEKLQGIHSVVGESNNGVIIVSGVSDTVRGRVLGQPHAITNMVPCGSINWANANLHQRVRLLLLLEDCCRGVHLL